MRMYKKKGLGLLWAEKKETSRPLLFASYASNCGCKLGNKSVNVSLFSPFNTKIPAYTKNIRNIERNPVVDGRTG